MDWISSKIYWTDIRTRWIGVLDLNSHLYKMLFMTTTDAKPREIVLDPTTRFVYSMTLYFNEINYVGGYAF